MWGSPGTMLAAAAMHELTGEARWLDLWRESAAWLRDEWDPETGLWTQHLYGRVEQFIGPAHGFAGCVLALSRDADDELHRRAAEATRPLRNRGGRARELAARCLGRGPATGSRRVDPRAVVSRCARCRRVACSVRARRRRARAVAARGRRADLARRAAVERGEPLPRHRRQRLRLPGAASSARAMSCGSSAPARSRCTHRPGAHARAEFGRGRYTLWTGDPGTALYLADCLAGGGTVPLP